MSKVITSNSVLISNTHPVVYFEIFGRLKTTSKAIANCIDEANGAEEISNVFYK